MLDIFRIQNCLAFKQSCNFFLKPAFPIFFQTVGISTIFKIWWWNWYDISWCMDGWNMIPWEFPVNGMNGSDIRGKTVGPVHFERIDMKNLAEWPVTDVGRLPCRPYTFLWWHTLWPWIPLGCWEAGMVVIMMMIGKSLQLKCDSISLKTEGRNDLSLDN